MDRIWAWRLLQRLIAGSRGPLCFWPDPKVLPSALWTPLLGFIKDRPSASTDAVRSLPGEPKPVLRPEVAKLRTRSALAVLPGYGGLLRSTPCRFVAPCIRPWGSPSFRSAPCPVPEGAGLGARLSLWRSTLRSFPLRGRPMRVTARRFPLVVAQSFWSRVLPCCHVWPRIRPLVTRPQGFAPLRSPLRARRRFHRRTARYSHGLGPRLVLMPSRRRSEEWRAAGPLRPRGTAEDWPGIRALPSLRRGGASWRPVHGLVGPWPRGASVRCVRRSDGPRRVRHCCRLACHPRVAALPAPRLAEPEGSGAPRVGRVEGARGRLPEGVAASPRRRAFAFNPAAGLPVPSGRRPEGRWRFGCRWLQVPGGSVAAVRGARRRPFPWLGARWVRRAVRIPEGTLPRGRGPWIPLLRVVGPVSPSPRLEFPKELCPWVGARWVRCRS